MADAPECVFKVKETGSGQQRNSFLIHEERMNLYLSHGTQAVQGVEDLCFQLNEGRKVEVVGGGCYAKMLYKLHVFASGSSSVI